MTSLEGFFVWLLFVVLLVCAIFSDDITWPDFETKT
jgi:hypothetical protein